MSEIERIATHYRKLDYTPIRLHWKVLNQIHVASSPIPPLLLKSGYAEGPPSGWSDSAVLC